MKLFETFLLVYKKKKLLFRFIFKKPFIFKRKLYHGGKIPKKVFSPASHVIESRELPC